MSAPQSTQGQYPPPQGQYPPPQGQYPPPQYNQPPASSPPPQAYAPPAQQYQPQPSYQQPQQPVAQPQQYAPPKPMNWGFLLGIFEFISWLLVGVGFIIFGDGFAQASALIGASSQPSVSQLQGPDTAWLIGAILIGVGFLILGISKLLGGINAKKTSQ